MPYEERKTATIQNIIMENREKLEISGVEDVDTFDENKIELLTSLGVLTVIGKGLHINKLNIEIGEVSVVGEIDSLVYTSEPSVNKGGFFGGIFK